MNKKTQGSYGELAAASAFLKEGWTVSFPFGENARYDFIAEKRGVFLRVQVKCVTPKEGVLEANFRSCNNWSVRRYSASEIDLIAVCDASNRNVYFVAKKDFDRSSIRLRVSAAKNGQKRFTRNAEEYTNLPLDSVMAAQ